MIIRDSPVPAENENRPHGNNGRIAETRQCLNGADESRQGHGTQSQQGGDLHRNPFGHQKQNGNSQNRKHQHDIRGHNYCSFPLRINLSLNFPQ
jgi:hypothetical protein